MWNEVGRIVGLSSSSALVFEDEEDPDCHGHGILDVGVVKGTRIHKSGGRVPNRNLVGGGRSAGSGERQGSAVGQCFMCCL